MSLLWFILRALALLYAVCFVFVLVAGLTMIVTTLLLDMKKSRALMASTACAACAMLLPKLSWTLDFPRDDEVEQFHLIVVSAQRMIIESAMWQELLIRLFLILVALPTGFLCAGACWYEFVKKDPDSGLARLFLVSFTTLYVVANAVMIPDGLALYFVFAQIFALLCFIFVYKVPKLEVLNTKPAKD